MDLSPEIKAQALISQVGLEGAKTVARNVLDTLQLDEIYNPGHLGFERVDNYWEKVMTILNEDNTPIV